MAAASLLRGRSATYAAARQPRCSTRRVLAVCTPLSASAGLLRRRSRFPVRQQRRSISLAARRTEYDDDEDWDDGPGLGIVPGILGGALGAVGGITDVVARSLPASVPRGVVDISVKAGLALVVLGFARSLLSLVTTIGTIVFGLWLASKVLGGGGDGKAGFSYGRQRRGHGRPRQRQNQRPPLSLPGSDTSGDLADVWFERQDGPRKGRRR